MMRTIFNDYGEPMDKLEVNTQVSTVRLTSTVDDIKVGIDLDKKSVVGLIQILAECLMEIDE